MKDPMMGAVVGGLYRRVGEEGLVSDKDVFIIDIVLFSFLLRHPFIL